VSISEPVRVTRKQRVWFGLAALAYGLWCLGLAAMALSTGESPEPAPTVSLPAAAAEEQGGDDRD
jgi:hypothetical protein